MGKQSKKKNAPKKSEQKPRRKKKMKNIGLAKYIHPETRQRKKKKISEPEQKDAQYKDKHLPELKKDNKNLSLIDRCKLQMSSSLLRLMDERLYESDTKSVSLDKEKFLAYHEAYASVSEKWPMKPIDYIVKFIKKRIVAKRPIDKIRFADIGCGKEPLLKKKLPPKARVDSFDLISAHEDVKEENMERLPIQDETIHCAVYSLSLMAKNLGQVILEGKRILKIGGSMLIVEVTSRFEGQEKKFASKLEKIGLKLKSTSSLKPNNYFTFFHFAKIDNRQDYPGSCTNIQLKPCAYKSR